MYRQYILYYDAFNCCNPGTGNYCGNAFAMLEAWACSYIFSTVLSIVSWHTVDPIQSCWVSELSGTEQTFKLKLRISKSTGCLSLKYIETVGRCVNIKLWKCFYLLKAFIGPL